MVGEWPRVPMFHSDTAGEPGVAQGEVGRLHDRVDVQQSTPSPAVVERQQPPTEVQGDGGPQDVVLEHRDAVTLRCQLSSVVVLGEVRQQCRRRPLAGADGDVGGDVRGDVPDRRRRIEHREVAARPERRRR